MQELIKPKVQSLQFLLARKQEPGYIPSTKCLDVENLKQSFVTFLKQRWPQKNIFINCLSYALIVHTDKCNSQYIIILVMTRRIKAKNHSFIISFPSRINGK